MSNPPATFGTDPSVPSGPDWDEAASLHQKDGEGVLYELKAIRRGSLADLVRYVMMLPEGQRQGYAIEKARDHRLLHREIAGLWEHPDFPRGAGGQT